MNIFQEITILWPKKTHFLQKKITHISLTKTRGWNPRIIYDLKCFKCWVVVGPQMNLKHRPDIPKKKKKKNAFLKTF